MDINFLSKTELFQGMSEQEIETLLSSLSFHEKSFYKNDTIFHAGKKINDIGIVLSGSVNVVVNYYWGGSSIFGHFEAGHIFGETYAILDDYKLMVDVVAQEDSRIMFINLNKLLNICQNSSKSYYKIIYNLIQIASRKNLTLSLRMMYTAPKTIREKLFLYLSAMAKRERNNEFSIPFSRQQLADYLGVDRSALSNELSKMKKDGLLECKKNRFKLLKKSNF